MATVLKTPFVSGRDSLNNEFRPLGAAEPISIPPSLLISALGQVDDVRHCVSMDLKRPGNFLYQVGATKAELGGSHFALIHGLTGGQVPHVDAELARQTFLAVHNAITAGLVSACHDLSEGGLAVAAAEMALAGGLGLRIALDRVPQMLAAGTSPVEAVLLFSESNTRFLCEVTREHAAAFEAALGNVPRARIGEVTAEGRLQIVGHAQNGLPLLVQGEIGRLKEAWQKPLRKG
jgi:phosphoribosylformylglycinamidine synthase